MNRLIFAGASPFNGAEEFANAEGAFYTFADRPALTGILLVVSLLIFLYFLYYTFGTSKGTTNAKNPAVLGLLIATGMATLLSASLETERVEAANRLRVRLARSSQQLVLAPLALIGVTTPLSSRKSKRKPSRKYRRR
ncbi:MAG: hypothetical protein ACOCZG_01025 [Halothece sp.]